METLRRLGAASGTVISTGGGCVTREGNYPLLHQNGVIVWLQRETAKLPRDGRPISLRSDLNELYAALDNNEDKDAIVSKAISLMKTYAIDNRGYAMELLPAYVAKVTVDDVTPLIKQAIEKLDNMSPETREQFKDELLPRLENFAISHRDLVVRTANYFLGSVTQDQMEQLLNVFKNTAMEQVFVYNKTFNFLDYYFQTTGIEAAIKAQVDNELDATDTDPGYLKRSQASDCTIEPCANN